MAPTIQLRNRLPLTPVLSGSTKASLTLPSSTSRAYRLLRLLPKMATLSKLRSRASVNFPVGSPRKRTYGENHVSINSRSERNIESRHTPLLPWGSRETPQAWVLYRRCALAICLCLIPIPLSHSKSCLDSPSDCELELTQMDH